jgi:hypothetical protein
MPYDARPVLQALGAVDTPVPVRSLDRVCDALVDTGILEAEHARDRTFITNAIGISLRSGWVHTDGVRITLSSSGRRLLEDQRLWPGEDARDAVARLGAL